MDLTSLKTIKNLLKSRGIRPSKRLGQNFLIDRRAVRKIVEAAELKPTDLVLEIGPGIGTLTQELANRARKVIAVEKDQKMVEILRETLRGFDNIEIVREDIRMSDTPQDLEGCRTSLKYKVVGNLPFYLTAPVIRQFLERPATPKLMVLVVQKEVAQRICAKPPKMNLLAVSIQLYSTPEVVYCISKKSFWPRPEVDAAIIKLKVKSQKLKVNKDLFFKIVKAGFSQPRKQLINNLSKGLKIDKKKMEAWLLENNIKPSQRAETLTIIDWLRLAKAYLTLK